MTEAIGVSGVSDLFADIPSGIRCDGLSELDKGLSEYEVRKRLEELAGRNVTGVSFLGGGSYDHLIPSIVDHVISMPEFYTAYTPYQAEISQGILQAIFEFQTMMCRIYSLDVSNASLYDGFTAAAEGCAVALNSVRGSRRLLVSSTVHPFTRKVIATFFSNLDVEVDFVPSARGVTDRGALERELEEGAACVLAQSPNMYGLIEDFGGWSETIHSAGGLFAVSANPLSLGALKSPGEWGADIGVGDGQPLGIPGYFGGPSVGIITATDRLLRKMPGRIVGETVDRAGARAFVLTLQAREQHIKRERATSNICSNQALMALACTAYLAALGESGFAEVAGRNIDHARYLAARLTGELPVELIFDGPFFNEFCIRLPKPAAEIAAKMARQGIFAGIPLTGPWSTPEGTDRDLMVAVTEKRSVEEMDRYVEILERCLI